MKDKSNALKNYIYANRKMLWYMLCFAFLGLIDQRKQSAPGLIQILFANLTPLVMAALLLPSLELRKFCHKVYVIWTPICVALIVFSYIFGKSYMPYMKLRISGICSIAVWSYLFLYIVREWKCIEGVKRIKQPFFWCTFLLFTCMMLSVNRDDIPYWYLMMYGGFYLIGIKKEDRSDFFYGLINGLILWFFVQQIIAFGFRPYDRSRYHGMYAGVTFNGLFYLLAYCAVSLKWLFAKQREAHWSIRFFWFFLSTGCVALVLLTGSRASLVGILLTTIVLYGWYDLKRSNSFYQLLLHAITWLLCVTIAFPLSYGCVRYLPTILHHPIWFEGEYIEGSSVCSFDSWDSEKYVSFEKSVDRNLGRILELLGIDLKEKKTNDLTKQIVLYAYAAGADMNGTIKAETITKSGKVEPLGGIESRKILYISGLAQLNLQGHTSTEILGMDGTIYDHAHNMFLDMAYRHGIVAGILYMGVCIYSILQTLWRRKPENIILVVFMLGLLSFGMFEQLTMMGQFGVALIWIFFYFVGEDSKVLFEKHCES